MKSVETVIGSVESSELGTTLMHEHIFSLNAEVRVQDASWDEELRIADAVEKVKDAYARGVRTMVDLTVYGLGRNFERVARVARESGMNIVGATGLYFFTDMPSYFRTRTARVSPTFIEDFLVREIEVGVFETGIRASIIKCVTDIQGVSKDVEFVLRSSARAQLRTGVPISTHTDAASRIGLEQQRIFREEGVDLGNVVIGHSGDSSDIQYLEQLIDAGSYVGMDRFGTRINSTLDERVQIVAKMCELGYADRMVLSHDTNCWSDNVPNDLRDTTPELTPARFTYVADEVLPRLKATGVSDAAINQMLVINPRQIFEKNA